MIRRIAAIPLLPLHAVVSSDDDDTDDDNNDVIMDKAAIDEQKDDSKDKDSPVQPLALSQEDPHRLFVRILPFSSTEENLQQHFQQYGKVTACQNTKRALPLYHSSRVMMRKGYKQNWMVQTFRGILFTFYQQNETLPNTMKHEVVIWKP
jgi:RNA recognition motif-containing protein